MKIAILQSNYIPWKGYFDLINMVDIFVLYDEVQYTKNDWRNRNVIKTPQGTKWITIPCQKNSLHQKIDETRIAKKDWGKNHWEILKSNYSRAKYFKQYKDHFEEIYLTIESNLLSEINYTFIKQINKLLQINTKIIYSKTLNINGEKTDRLVKICEKLGADIYLSGPAAKSYLEEHEFKEKGIKVVWMDYSGYEEYVQLFPPFEHAVTILDLLFNTGPEAPKYMKSFKK